MASVALLCPGRTLALRWPPLLKGPAMATQLSRVRSFLGSESVCTARTMALLVLLAYACLC